MFEDAGVELDSIDEGERTRVEVLASWADIHCGLEQWWLMQTVAAKLARLEPDQPQWQITWAHAARFAQSVDAARRILLEAVERLPEAAVLQYNLACYENLLGEAEVAKARLLYAFRLDPKLRPKARQDEDLASMRDWL